jgi:hypothetical protein
MDSYDVFLDEASGSGGGNGPSQITSPSTIEKDNRDLDFVMVGVLAFVLIMCVGLWGAYRKRLSKQGPEYKGLISHSPPGFDYARLLQ